MIDGLILIDWLIGWQIQFWRTDRPDEKRKEDIVLRPHFDRCPPLHREMYPDPRKRKRRQHAASSAVVTGSTNRLWPNSRIQAGVMALNQVNQGNLSQIVEFQTPEGGLQLHPILHFLLVLLLVRVLFLCLPIIIPAFPLLLFSFLYFAMLLSTKWCDDRGRPLKSFPLRWEFVRGERKYGVQNCEYGSLWDNA